MLLEFLVELNTLFQSFQLCPIYLLVLLLSRSLTSSQSCCCSPHLVPRPTAAFIAALRHLCCCCILLRFACASICSMQRQFNVEDAIYMVVCDLNADALARQLRLPQFHSCFTCHSRPAFCFDRKSTILPSLTTVICFLIVPCFDRSLNVHSLLAVLSLHTSVFDSFGAICA